MKIYSKIILGLAAVGTLAACEDQMEYHEYGVYDKEYMQNYWSRVAGFTTVIYNDLDYDFGNHYAGALLASASDESVYSHEGNTIEAFWNGAWSPSTPLSYTWDAAWEGISYCNLLIDEFSNLTFDDWYNDKTYAANLYRVNNFKYEARWARAYFYFTLVRQYGKVPLKVSNGEASEDNSLQQMPADSIFAFIESECDAIKDSIVKEWDKLGVYALNYTDDGRANDLAVLALKAHAALYHASPLFNESNDKELWKKALDAHKELFEACNSTVYNPSMFRDSLMTSSDFATKRNIKLHSSYAELFDGTKTYTIDEVFFCRRVAAANSYEKYNFPIGLTNAGGGNCPTQNLVDAYETINGLPIAEDPEYDGVNAPYANRDPRLAATIAVNGEQWPDALNNASGGLETYYNGVNGLPTTYGTPTGYYLKKYCNKAQDITTSSATTSTHCYIYFRLGEFYLNFAECMMEYYGDVTTQGDYGMSALEAVNLVRQRAGMPDLAAADLTQERYRNERRVELAFEGHRFWDIRRWKAGEEQDLNITSANITFNQVDSVSTYGAPEVLETRTWQDKYYFFPIPQDELLQSSGGWEQTPGW